ncbi:MAG: hypothetical protein A2992_02955 [Elusimicrobia bacterium RIFCSPLOWO2_01_FULL_59_12]|nr:MAG: hypothetical protein A2992_02955 [Elusimicrobia bacterium RIFCSPLOWO2_01_FULL_59_12]
MPKERADHPFVFCTEISQVELTGHRARDLTELVNHLDTVPGSVIYHHTHHFLRQHHFLSPEPRNDFAYWVTQVLKEEKLGEQLAAIDTVRFRSIRALREKLIDVIRHYLAQGRTSRTVPEAEAFHFMKSRSFIVSTALQARTLGEFAAGIEKVSVHALYHHIFEARLRLERGTNDFSNWLENELDEKTIADAINRMDPYTQTLDALRSRILRAINDRLRERAGTPHAP